MQTLRGFSSPCTSDIKLPIDECGVSDTQPFLAITGSSNILNDSYLTSINDDSAPNSGVVFTTCKHFCYYKLLEECGLIHSAKKVLECPTASGCQVAAQHIIDEHVAALLANGSDQSSIISFRAQCIDSLRQFLSTALKFRFQNEPMFCHSLMSTQKALLVICEPNDPVFGVGMDKASFEMYFRSAVTSSNSFVHFLLNQLPTNNIESGVVKAEEVSVGKNLLGLELMRLRTSMAVCHLKSDIRLPLGIVMLPNAVEGDVPMIEPLAEMTTADDKSMPNFFNLIVSDLKRLQLPISTEITCLQGLFKPLSNNYLIAITMDGRSFPSPIHYCYFQWLVNLGLGEKGEAMLLSNKSVNEIPQFAQEAALLGGFFVQSDTKAQSLLECLMIDAIRAKFKQNETLQHILMCSINSLLVEDSSTGDYRWSACVDEEQLADWMSDGQFTISELYNHWLGIKKLSQMENLGANYTGLLLMLIRAEYLQYFNEQPGKHEPIQRATCGYLAATNFVPAGFHCFDPDSPYSPGFEQCFYGPDKIKYQSVQQYACVEASRWLQLENSNYLMCVNLSELSKCLSEKIEEKCPSPKRLFEWYNWMFEETLKKAYRSRIEQYPNFKAMILSTGFELIVFCVPLTTRQREWGIGMSEIQFLKFLDSKKLTALDIFRMMMGTSSDRSTEVGGNRLGLILMELREEYRQREGPATEQVLSDRDRYSKTSRSKGSKQRQSLLELDIRQPARSAAGKGQKFAASNNDDDLINLSVEELRRVGKQLIDEIADFRTDIKRQEQEIGSLNARLQVMQQLSSSRSRRSQ